MFLSKKCKEIMQNEMSEAFSAHIDKQRKDRRRRIFEQVALAYIPHYYDNYKDALDSVSFVTERIIKAADEFAEKGSEKI